MNEDNANNYNVIFVNLSNKVKEFVRDLCRIPIGIRIANKNTTPLRDLAKQACPLFIIIAI